MDSEQRAYFIERVRGLEQRGEALRAQLTFNPDRVARFELEDQIADVGEEIADLRRETAAA